MSRELRILLAMGVFSSVVIGILIYNNMRKQPQIQSGLPRVEWKSNLADWYRAYQAYP